MKKIRGKHRFLEWAAVWVPLTCALIASGTALTIYSGRQHSETPVIIIGGCMSPNK